MALMKFREQNHVKWIGTRPGHDGTQIMKSNTATNAIVIIHTVTAGKTLYLIEAALNTADQITGYANVSIRDGGDVFVRTLCAYRSQADTSLLADHWSAFPPLEIPAGYDIYVQTGAALFAARGNIFGWEE